MGVNVKVELEPSFYKKVDPNWKNMFSEILRDVALQAENECKHEAPLKTGALRRGHSVKSGILEAGVYNNMEYWVDVVYGTKPHVIVPKNKKALWWKTAQHPVPKVNHPGNKPNNYPQRVISKLLSQNIPTQIGKQVLSKYGVE